MADFKITNDPVLNVPVATPLNRSGETIETIYKKSSQTPSVNSAAPANVQVEQKPNNALPSTIIDVVKNYDWAASPKNDIVEHPYIYLTEYRINKSPLLAQLSYLAKAGIESTGEAIKSVTDLFKEGAVTGVLNDLGGAASGASRDIVDFITNLEIKNGAVSEEFQDMLKPYTSLYYTKETGFEYKLPYFTNTMAERTGNWDRKYPGDSEITKLIQSGADFVAEYGSGVPIMGAYAEPGIYIERSRYFNPSPGQEPLQFNFPLLNTLDPNSIQKNFNLVWLLSFQNSSIRRSKTSVYPPCIYRVLIPGVRYMLYSNIANLSIEYLGTRRRVPITHPASGSEIDIIIPEAYNLTFTINNLTAESGNLMLKSLTNV